jgi:hypothetical protein
MRPHAANFSTPAVYVNQDADDLALVARCTAGDTDAFEALVERYHRVLFTVAVRMLGDTDDASDAAQNAFIKAYQKLETFDRSRRFFSWIYRILVNECLNACRDRPRHEPIAADVAAADTPADLFETAQRRDPVQSAILARPAGAAHAHGRARGGGHVLPAAAGTGAGGPGEGDASRTRSRPGRAGR